MKTKLLLFPFFIGSFHGIAQETNDISVLEVNPLNSVEHPCITPWEYQLIEQNCNANAQKYILNTSRNSTQTALNWPLKASDALTDCNYFYISAHVDHDAAASAFHDYNCGTLTYDGHTGTDIAIGPFGFYKMDNNQVEVIAAASGTIIDKHDGEFDRQCVGSGSGLTANYIIIQHADGSRALYWHMKKNSLTTKVIGQTVASGEFLGIVGSSGSSSGPHLHFEVWSGNTAATKIDPFAGTCNLINATSWWNAQKPYKEPAILKASIHTTDVVMPGCPITETPNESTTYTIPFQGSGLSPGYAKFYIFMRNVSAGTAATMQILNPNGSVFNSWSYNFTSYQLASYYGFSKLLPTNPGIYTFEAAYNGNTCSQQFTINNPLGVAEQVRDETIIYPNPVHNLISIHLNKPLTRGTVNLYSETGQKVKAVNNVYGQDITLERETLTNGIYFLQLLSDGKAVFTKKIIYTD